MIKQEAGLPLPAKPNGTVGQAQWSKVLPVHRPPSLRLNHHDQYSATTTNSPMALRPPLSREPAPFHCLSLTTPS
jgi:hypothetical protein